MKSISEAIKEASNKCKLTFTLMEEQIRCLTEVGNKKDVLAVLPTGYGKTIIYGLIPNLFDALHNEISGHNMILVISPLIALMEDQVHKLLNTYSVSAACVTSAQPVSDITQNMLRQGLFQVVIASPETSINPGWFRDILKSRMYRERLKAIVIDEAHCILEWGEDFRRDYKHLVELRSLFNNATVLALTATASTAMRKDIIRNLHLDAAAMCEISKAANRLNVYYACQATKGDLEMQLSWLVNKLLQEQEACPKHIIYCRSLDSCGEVFKVFLDSLREKSYVNGIEGSKNRLFAMYHKSTWEWNKAHILEEFRKPNSIIRVVIATVCFGMGIDVADIQTVIHWRAPRSFEAWYQESGRAGRNGSENSYSIIYVLNRDFSYGDNEENMKLYCGKNFNVCRREFIAKHFTPEHEVVRPAELHDCCDICRTKCQCKQCPNLWF